MGKPSFLTGEIKYSSTACEQGFQRKLSIIYWMDEDMEPFAPPCPLRLQAVIRVKYLQTECNALAAARRVFLKSPFTLQYLRTDPTNRKNLVTFG